MNLLRTLRWFELWVVAAVMWNITWEVPHKLVARNASVARMHTTSKTTFNVVTVIAYLRWFRFWNRIWASIKVAVAHGAWKSSLSHYIWRTWWNIVAWGESSPGDMFSNIKTNDTYIIVMLGKRRSQSGTFPDRKSWPIPLHSKREIIMPLKLPI